MRRKKEKQLNMDKEEKKQPSIDEEKRRLSKKEVQLSIKEKT